MAHKIEVIGLAVLCGACAAVLLFGPGDFLSAQGYYCCSLDNCPTFDCESDEGTDCKVMEGEEGGGECKLCFAGNPHSCNGRTEYYPAPKVVLLKGCNGPRFTSDSGYISRSLWKRTTEYRPSGIGGTFGAKFSAKIDPNFHRPDWGSICQCGVGEQEKGAYIQAGAWAYIRLVGCGENVTDPTSVDDDSSPDYSTWNQLGLVSLATSGTGQNCQESTSGDFDPAVVSLSVAIGTSSCQCGVKQTFEQKIRIHYRFRGKEARATGEPQVATPVEEIKLECDPSAGG